VSSACYKNQEASLRVFFLQPPPLDSSPGGRRPLTPAERKLVSDFPEHAYAADSHISPRRPGRCSVNPDCSLGWKMPVLPTPTHHPQQGSIRKESKCISVPTRTLKVRHRVGQPLLPRDWVGPTSSTRTALPVPQSPSNKPYLQLKSWVSCGRADLHRH